MSTATNDSEWTLGIGYVNVSPPSGSPSDGIRITGHLYRGCVAHSTRLELKNRTASVSHERLGELPFVPVCACSARPARVPNHDHVRCLIGHSWFESGACSEPDDYTTASILAMRAMQEKIAVYDSRYTNIAL